MSCSVIDTFIIFNYHKAFFSYYFHMCIVLFFKEKKEANAAKNQPPTVLLENLRHLLIEYRRELDHLSTDVSGLL